MYLYRFFVMLLLVLTFQSVRSQTWYGYSYTTGVDTTKWITLTDPDTIRRYNQYGMYSRMVELAFPFGFFGSDIRSFCVSHAGVVVCNRTYNSEIPLQQIDLLSQNYANPLIFLFGQNSYVTVMAAWQMVGVPGSRTLVCEIALRRPVDTLQECRFQLQLDEATLAVRFVYGANTVNDNQGRGSIGFTGSSSRFINISPISHEVSNQVLYSNNLSWPGIYRYYEFTPVCANVAGLTVSHVGYNSALVSWSHMSSDSCYIIRYGRPNSTYSERVIRDTSIIIDGLQRCTLYNVQVLTICKNGQISGDASIRFRTVAPSCTNIPFTSLWDDFVECRTGNFTRPSAQIEVVDSGYRSDRSRHTVHCDTAERDLITQYQLRTIPVGYCSSVRLGNSRSGREQESITYTLHVDTNDYDLLLLRYAIVAQNPEHPEYTQPHVLFTITSMDDSLAGPCYSATFVSGALSGWLPAREGSDILWRDWAVYGIELGDLHGQTVRLTISNFDCGEGDHWGYVYFTLEGVSKRLTSTVCGASTENTFRAPKGFNYRWYSADNPSVTLSTDDTLHVTTPGVYYCHATYQLAGNDCGFTVVCRAGMRYPVARFSSTTVGGCTAVRRFVNESVIATDAAHTQLTTEPCERYLWHFSDGTTDSATNVTRAFSNGTHTVTLIAMLANGSCIDSVSQTFTVSIPSDTIYVSSCWGVPYCFGDMVVTQTGQYSYVDSCVEHILFFTVLSEPPTTIIDTICKGDTLFMGDEAYFLPGYYTQAFLNQYGCDSLVNLQLWTMSRYSIELRDTLPVGSQYPVGDTAFTAPGRYEYRMSSIYGCDSVLNIQLSCSTEKDTTICESSLPFVWDTLIFNEAGGRRLSFVNQAGTDSIITYTLHVREMARSQLDLDQSCDSDLYYIVEAGGGYHYTWQTGNATNWIDTIVADSLYYIHANDPSYYYVQVGYPDDPQCPTTDSIYLDPTALQLIIVDFSIYPEHPSSEYSSITLTDLSQNILTREWYVNGMLWPEAGATAVVDLSLSDDTIEICMVGYRNFCHLSVCKKVAVDWQSIYFPNIFTPDRDINNRFTACGVGITDFEIWIYDRRGMLVYHTTDIGQGWDGTSGGIKCRQEAYAYTCRYRLKQEQGYQTHTGTVLLLR